MAQTSFLALTAAYYAQVDLNPFRLVNMRESPHGNPVRKCIITYQKWKQVGTDCLFSGSEAKFCFLPFQSEHVQTQTFTRPY